MNLQNLKNDELELSFQKATRYERHIMHVVLLHIQEVARRKLYLAKGYGSLFEYLTKAMHYSGSAAQRRIEAARLMTEVPSVAEKIQSGELNLSQIGDIQRAAKTAEKLYQEKVTAQTKAQIVESVLNLSSANTQQVCAEALAIPVIEAEVIKTQRDKSKRIAVTFSERQYAKYEQLRDFLAHKNFQAKRTQEMADVLETCFDELATLLGVTFKSDSTAGPAMKSVSQEEVQSGSKARVKTDENIKVSSAAAVVTPFVTGPAMKSALQEEVYSGSKSQPNIDQHSTVGLTASPVTDSAAAPVNYSVTAPAAKWNSLTPKRKRMILAQDQCCQYEDYETGKVCGSKFNLQVDHIQPRWAGGSNDPGNLRVLCREHNQFRFQASERVFGESANLG